MGAKIEQICSCEWKVPGNSLRVLRFLDVEKFLASKIQRCRKWLVKVGIGIADMLDRWGFQMCHSQVIIFKHILSG